MRRLPFLLLLGALTLTGFGCTQKPTTEPLSSYPVIQNEEPEAPQPTPDTPHSTQDTPCPDGTVRYWHTNEWGEGLTFCHEETSVNKLPVTISSEGNTTILSIEGFEQTVVPIATINNPNTAESAIGEFMTLENKEACSIVANKNMPEGMDQYMIAGGDLEAQEHCGSAKDGVFYMNPQTHDMFYVRMGQDALFPSETWIQTLQIISTDEHTEASAPKELHWLNRGSLAHYEDREMGVAFDYPVRWGPIQRGEERGTTDPMDITKDDCTHQRQMIFVGLGRSVIIGAVGDSTDACEIGGRGGYFGDASNHLSEDLATQTECEIGYADACDSVKTNQGQTLWHWHYNEKDNFGDIYKDVDEYAIYHKSHPMTGVVFSDERLVSNHLGTLDPLFTALVKSLELIPAK